MQASDLLREAQRRTGLNAAGLSKASGLSESMISRTLRGKNDPSFDAIARGLEQLGFSLTLTPLEQATAEFAGIHMQDLLHAIELHQHDDDQWTHISASLRTLLEFPDSMTPSFEYVSKNVENAQWKAFMAGLYDFQHWDENHPRPDSLKLETPWTPLRKIYRSATRPSEPFLRYNVVIPEGELQWR